MDDRELLAAVLENVLATDDPAELARYQALLEDPERLAALAEDLNGRA